MAERPGQVPAAAGHGDLRASHADREQVIGTLKAAFVQGRLAKSEFDLRVGQALTSRTYAGLAAVTTDLPAGLTATQPARSGPAPAGRSVLRGPRLVMAASTVLYAGMWPLALALPADSEGYPLDGSGLIGTATLGYILVLIVAFVWAQVLGSRREEHSDGQLPGWPAAGADSQAPWLLPSADPGGQLPPADTRHTAEAARRRLPRPPSPARGHRACGVLA
jgi:hypothetical protein